MIRRATASAIVPGPLICRPALFGPLSVPDGAGRVAKLEELSRRAAVYATRARGVGTRRPTVQPGGSSRPGAHSLGREPLAADPDTIAMYVVRCADQGLAVSSIRVHLAAIRTAHLLAGLSVDLRHPRLAMVVEGVTRAKGVRPRRQAAPAVPGVLRLWSPPAPPLTRRSAPALVGQAFPGHTADEELIPRTSGSPGALQPFPGCQPTRQHRLSDGCRSERPPRQFCGSATGLLPATGQLVLWLLLLPPLLRAAMVISA